MWVYSERRRLLAQASKKIWNHSQTAATAKIFTAKIHSLSVWLLPAILQSAQRYIGSKRIPRC